MSAAATFEEEILATLEVAAANDLCARERSRWKDVPADQTLEQFVAAIDDGQIEHLAELTAGLYAASPRDRTVGRLHGLVSGRLIRIRRQPSDAVVASARERRAAAVAESRAMNAVSDEEFWALVDEDCGSRCPDCGSSYGSQPARIGWRVRCRGGYEDMNRYGPVWRPCGAEYDFLPVWRERYRGGLAADGAA